MRNFRKIWSLLVGLSVFGSALLFSAPAVQAATLPADSNILPVNLTVPQPCTVGPRIINAETSVNKDNSIPSEQPTVMPVGDDPTPTPCVAQDVQPVVPCVDGNIRANLKYEWSEATGTVTVRTADGGLLCNDVTLYLSNYVLPASYDGSGIFDDSALPQQLFDSTKLVLQKDTSGGVTGTIKVPNACTDYQMDLYYSPEITDVPYAGHGVQLIYGRIYPHTETDCTPPVVGGMGGGENVPPVTSTPPVVTAVLSDSTTVKPVAHVQAARLVNTGAPVLLDSLVAFLVATAAIVTVRLPLKKAN